MYLDTFYKKFIKAETSSYTVYSIVYPIETNIKIEDCHCCFCNCEFFSHCSLL